MRAHQRSTIGHMSAEARCYTARRLFIVTVFATMALLSVDVRAQESPGAPHAAEIVRMQQVIDDLQARLKKVEDKFEKPLTVKAPFTVENEHGKRVLLVANEEGPEITLGSDQTPAFRVVDNEEGVRLTLDRGQSQILLQASSDDRAIIAAAHGEMYSRFFTSTDNGSVVEVVQGATRSQLGVHENKSRVKLWQNGKPLFFVEAGAETSLKLGDAQKPAFTVKDSAGHAVLDLAKGSTHVRLRAEPTQSLVDLISGSSNRVQAIASAGAGSVKVTSGGSDGKANSGSSLAMTLDAVGPRFDVAREGKKAVTLGTAPDSKANTLRMYDEQGNLSIETGLGEQDQPGIWLWRDGDDVASLRAAAQGGSMLELFDIGGQLAADFVSSGKEPGMLRIYKQAERAVEIGLTRLEEPTVLLWSDGSKVVDISAKKGAGGLDLYDRSARIVGLGIDKGGGAGVLELRDKNDDTMAVIGSDANEGSLTLYEPGDKASAILGAYEGRDTGLRLFSDNHQIAAIGIDTAGHGAISLLHKSGTKLATITTDTDGGQFVAHNSAGTPVASIAVSSSGAGAVEFASAKGTPLGVLAQSVNGGILQLNNLSGVPMVEAGNLGTVGIVRTGPLARPGGLLAGSFIMGKQ